MTNLTENGRRIGTSRITQAGRVRMIQMWNDGDSMDAIAEVFGMSRRWVARQVEYLRKRGHRLADRRGITMTPNADLIYKDEAGVEWLTEAGEELWARLYNDARVSNAYIGAAFGKGGDWVPRMAAKKRQRGDDVPLRPAGSRPKKKGTIYTFRIVGIPCPTTVGSEDKERALKEAKAIAAEMGGTVERVE